jgi:glutamate formiminotransferase/formiminotetrahydrofolate cyclodeaminase
MVASMPKHRAGSADDVDRLRAAARRCGDLSERLAALADEDSAAYDRVIGAYQLPKTSEGEKAERTASIQAALASAIDVPLEVMRRSAEAVQAAVIVAAFGNRNAASDVGVALELLRAAQRGARLNVEINLESVKDTNYAGRIRRQLEELEAEGVSAAAAATARLREEA